MVNNPQMWQTPQASDVKGRMTAFKNQHPTQACLSLRGQVNEWASTHQDQPTPMDGETISKREVLSPSFVEGLMGWPIGWTDFAPLETASYRSRLRSHFASLLIERGLISGPEADDDQG